MANHHDKLIIAKAGVEGIIVEICRDPGGTTMLVRDSLIPKNKFTGRRVDTRWLMIWYSIIQRHVSTHVCQILLRVGSRND